MHGCVGHHISAISFNSSAYRRAEMWLTVVASRAQPVQLGDRPSSDSVLSVRPQPIDNAVSADRHQQQARSTVHRVRAAKVKTTTDTRIGVACEGGGTKLRENRIVKPCF